MTVAATGDLPGLGFVGLGGWGRQLAAAAQRSGAVRVVAGFARGQEARDAFADTFDARPVDRFEALLEDEAVAGVVIATPHSIHLPMIRAAAEAGTHVLVEKPLTVRYRDAQDAVEAARGAGIVLQVGHHRRRTAAVRELARRAHAGAFGTVHLLEGKMTTPTDLRPRGGWRGDPDECPLGGMTALGVHLVDTVHAVAGPVARVHAASRRLLARSALDDITVLSLELASGALATLSCSTVLPRESSFAVHGHEGSGWSEQDGDELYLQGPTDARRERADLTPVDALADQVAEFAACIATGADPEVTGERGRDVVAVLEAARLSVAEDRPVAVQEVLDGAAAGS